MTEATPPDWVLIEAAKRCEWANTLTITYLQGCYTGSGSFRALCDMILKYEQPPIDRKLLCAREACAGAYKTMAGSYQAGVYDNLKSAQAAIRAIELWEEGFGKS